MKVRVRLTEKNVTYLSNLTHGLHLIRDKTIVQTNWTCSKSFKHQKTIELGRDDASIVMDLIATTGLSMAAIIRAALDAAAKHSTLLPAPILSRPDALAALRAGGKLRRTSDAARYNQAAELFDADGTSLGFLAANVLASIPISLKTGARDHLRKSRKKWVSLARASGLRGANPQ